MSCSKILTGISHDCVPVKGGIKKVWITNTNPKPTTEDEPISINLAWYGFAVLEEDGNFFYNLEVANPGDSMAFKVNPGDKLSLTLPVSEPQSINLYISLNQTADIIEHYETFATPKHNKFTITIGEELGKALEGQGWLSIHVDPTEHFTETPTCYNIKNYGKIIKFDNNSDWFEYYFRKNTGSMTSTYTIDPANGVNFVSTELSLTFNKMDAAKREELTNLISSDVYAIVLDSNNKYWYLGFNEPVTVTAGTGQTGTAKSDGNNYQITLTDESHELPFEVLESLKPLPTPVINIYSGLMLANAKLTPWAARIDGTITYGNIVTLFSNLGWLQQTWYDKDTGDILGTVYMAKSEPLSLELNRPSGKYNIAIIGR